MIIIKPYAVQFTKDAIVLLIRKNESLSELVMTAASTSSQTLLENIQIVLVRGLFKQRKRMFHMPNTLDAFSVSNASGHICSLEITEEGAIKLDSIVRALVGESYINVDRKYRVDFFTQECEDTVLGGLFAA